MELITKMRIYRPCYDVFEAFVDPARIGNFWFSSGSVRWEPGREVTLRYDEFNAVVKIRIVDIEANRKIVFHWGENDEERTVTINIYEQDSDTLVEIIETGWIENENLTNQLIWNKEGWVYMLTCLKGYLENGVNTLRTGIVV